MPEATQPKLSGVAETLLITLYIRALESQRPDALLNDEQAVELFTRQSLDFSRVRQIPLSAANKLVIVLRSRQFDRYAQAFMTRRPDAVVVHIGCGLDTRFARVDNGWVEWYDLDFPDVIALRRQLIGGEQARYHLVGCSVFDPAWLEVVGPHRQRPCLFLAEGVSMHLKGTQMKSLLLTLREHFPGAELVFDAYSPIHLLVSNIQTARSGLRCHWGLWHGRQLEGWGAGIRLLDEWGYFDEPEPRLAPVGWLRPFDRLLRTLRIYHFQLGAAADK